MFLSWVDAVSASAIVCKNVSVQENLLNQSIPCPGSQKSVGQIFSKELSGLVFPSLLSALKNDFVASVNLNCQNILPTLSSFPATYRKVRSRKEREGIFFDLNNSK